MRRSFRTLLCCCWDRARGPKTFCQSLEYLNCFCVQGTAVHTDTHSFRHNYPRLCAYLRRIKIQFKFIIHVKLLRHSQSRIDIITNGTRHFRRRPLCSSCLSLRLSDLYVIFQRKSHKLLLFSLVLSLSILQKPLPIYLAHRIYTLMKVLPCG